MTDKQFEDCKRRVQALLDEWAFGKDRKGPRIPSLKDWIIVVRYSREGIQMPDGDEAGAQVVSSWFYKTAEIDFNCLNLHDLTTVEIERTVLHELCHLLVNEMREWGGKYGEREEAWSHHEERVVTDLSMAFLQTKYWERESLEGPGRVDDEAGANGEVGE